MGIEYRKVREKSRSHYDGDIHKLLFLSSHIDLREVALVLLLVSLYLEASNVNLM